MDNVGLVVTHDVKVGFDVGGVLSKYPDIFKSLILALDSCPATEVHIVSDMHPKEKIIAMLALNGINVDPSRVHSADFQQYGEACQAVLAEELGLDVLFDDFPAYVSGVGKPPVRLLVMPDLSRPYYDDSWKTDGTEGSFGRSKHAPF